MIHGDFTGNQNLDYFYDNLFVVAQFIEGRAADRIPGLAYVDKIGLTMHAFLKSCLQATYIAAIPNNLSKIADYYSLVGDLPQYNRYAMELLDYYDEMPYIPFKVMY